MIWLIVIFAALLLASAIAAVTIILRLKNQVIASARDVSDKELARSRFEVLYQGKLSEAARLEQGLKEVQAELDQLERELEAGAAHCPKELTDRLRRRLSETGV